MNGQRLRVLPPIGGQEAQDLAHDHGKIGRHRHARRRDPAPVHVRTLTALLAELTEDQAAKLVTKLSGVFDDRQKKMIADIGRMLK